MKIKPGMPVNYNLEVSQEELKIIKLAVGELNFSTVKRFGFNVDVHNEVHAALSGIALC